jgi:hypothetical protein
LARGFLARRGRFKNKANEHIAAVRVVNDMVERVIEDELIPDIIIAILKKNSFYDDVGLQSVENQSLYEARNSIVTSVLRVMIREVINDSVNSIINGYMRSRSLYIEPEDKNEPLNNPVDPLSLAARQILDDFMRVEIKQIL